MKKTSIILTLATMLVAMVSCSKDEQPVSGKFTMTVNADKGTRATKDLSLDGSTLNAMWKAGESVTVTNENGDCLGFLYATTDGSNTILSGTITGTIAENDILTLEFLSEYYDQQEGTLEFIATHSDYAKADVTIKSISSTSVTTTDAVFENQQAIVKFTLRNSDNSADINATKLEVTVGSTTYTVDPKDPEDPEAPETETNVFYVAIPGFSGESVTLSATVGDDTYTYEKSSATFTNGQYYTISVQMTKVLPECSYTAPSLRTGLTFNGNSNNVAGSAQALVTGGSATNATMYYSKDGTNWSTDVPTQTDAGSYTVYYKVVPDDGYTGGVESTSLGSATMAKANGWCSLSPNSSSGWLTSTKSKSATSTVTHHGGTLTHSKSGPGSNYLSVSFSGNTMNLYKPRENGLYDVYVTVYSDATQNYNAASATYFCGQ